MMKKFSKEIEIQNLEPLPTKKRFQYSMIKHTNRFAILFVNNLRLRMLLSNTVVLFKSNYMSNNFTCRFRSIAIIFLLLLLNSLFSIQTAFAQEMKTVRGKIFDNATQKSLPGTTIKVKSTGKEVITNNEGRFEVQASNNDLLHISFVGYNEQDIPLHGQSTVNVGLTPESSSLNEVVVVGYGLQKKVNLTGAVATVDKKMIENRPVTNALSALQGAASGVTVTRTTGIPGQEGYNVQVRGLSSVNGGDVLVVIDGAPGGDLSTLNPDDIESISVLKDAAAAAIYGARAANGVILVSTKKGKTGKPVVNYTSLFSLQKPINILHSPHSWEQYEMYNVALRNSTGNNVVDDTTVIGYYKDPDFNYILQPSGAYSWYDDADPNAFFLKKYSPQQNHNISVSGGGDKSTYFVSLGYFGQDGVWKFGPDNTSRINARINYHTEISKTFSFDSKINYTQTKASSPAGDQEGNATTALFYDLYRTRVWAPFFLPDDSTHTKTTSRLYGKLNYQGKNESKSNDFNAVLSLKAKNIVNGLTLTALYAPDYFINQSNEHLKPYSAWSGPGIETLLNAANSLTKGNRIITRNNVQLLADYDFQIANKNVFHVLGGYSFDDYRSNSTTAVANNLTSDVLESLNLGDPTLSEVSDNIQTWAMMSYFGRLNYNFDNRFLFESNIRYDASSKLAPAYRWKIFPSVSAGWRINNEKWFAPLQSVFNEVKIRASWGQLGNSDVLGNYDYLSLLRNGSITAFNGVINNSIYQSSLSSSLKSWEIVQTSNIGLDVTLLKNRLSFTADYYEKRNKNMLAPVNVTSAIGIGLSNYNVGELKTWGWEISLGWHDKIRQFDYWINGNLSDDQNKILKYGSNSVIIAGTNQILQGMPYNSIFGYIDEGYFQNDDEVSKHAFQFSNTGPGDISYKDINGDSVISTPDLVYLGNTQPRFSYGIDLGFSWKGIDLSAFFQGVGERSVLISTASLLPFASSSRQPLEFNKDYWTPDNPNATFPRLFVNDKMNAVPSSHWVMNGAYLRLKNLQIGYTLPSSISNKIKIKTIRIFFSGQDLLEISKMWLKLYDPEVPNLATFQYPYFRTYALGLNVKF